MFGHWPKVMFEYIFQGNDGDVRKRYETAKSFLQDILLELPASSVEVEKAHANLQYDIHVYCSNAKTHPESSETPTSCQLWWSISA
jgi:hypothetical protein